MKECIHPLIYQIAVLSVLTRHGLFHALNILFFKAFAPVILMVQASRTLRPELGVPVIDAREDAVPSPGGGEEQMPGRSIHPQRKQTQRTPFR